MTQAGAEPCMEPTAQGRRRAVPTQCVGPQASAHRPGVTRHARHVALLAAQVLQQSPGWSSSRDVATPACSSGSSSVSDSMVQPRATQVTKFGTTPDSTLLAAGVFV